MSFALGLAAVLAGAGLAAHTVQSVDPNAGETKDHRDARMKWWREARFGMFIHWGLYAQLAGTWEGKQTPGLGEWIMHDDKIPVADYAAQAANFNPAQFNADQWVSIAKAAGMKYIVMTAKHHEGFAMYRTKTDGYNIYDATPFKREPILEMAAACKKQGLKFGVYYSQAQDWHHAGGGAYGGHWDSAQDGDLHKYVKEVAAPQVAELMERVKPAVLWWDTPVDMSPEDVRELTGAFSKDPGLIANNRLGNGVPGDTETPEQYVPATGFPGRDWETCMTINDTWGYKSFDTNYKSTQMLLRNLIDIASKGGNYLLNVGPEPTGLIPQPEVDRLREIGDWLKKNGESIYGTSASPYKKLPFDGRATVKGNTLYLNVFTWPEDGLKLKGLQTAVKSVRSVDGQKLAVRVTDDGIAIGKPRDIDPLSTPIAISCAGPIVVTEPEYLIAPHADGTLHLDAAEANPSGHVQLQDSGSRANLGFWTDQSDTVEWKVSAPASATYAVKLDYSCATGSGGSTFEIRVDGAASGVTGKIEETGSWDSFKTVDLTGTLSLSAGRHVITVVPTSKPGLAVMNLRHLLLSPSQ